MLALDIATSTGWCHGQPGDDIPQCGSVRFGRAGTSHGAILANCFDWLVDFTKTIEPDTIVIEDLLPFGAKIGATNKNTGDLLGGLHGVVRLVAFKREIYDFHAVSASAVRGHFIDGRGYKRARAKRYVIDQCRRLGWLPEDGPRADEDAADACAIWSFWCSRIDPMQALKVSPLFRGVAP